MIFVHYILRGHSVGACLYGDRHAVLIGAADEEDILSPHPEISYIYVGRHIDSGQMADMHRTVGVRQSACHKRSLEVLFH